MKYVKADKCESLLIQTCCFRQYLPDAEVLFSELSYELIPAIYHSEKLIRDVKDQPILNAAIVFGVDIILTGDKDFLSLDIEHPQCMTAAEFLRV